MTTDTILHTTVIIQVIYELFNHIVEHKCFHLLSYIWYLSIILTLNRTPMWPIASNQIVAHFLKMNSKGIYTEVNSSSYSLIRQVGSQKLKGTVLGIYIDI